MLYWLRLKGTTQLYMIKHGNKPPFITQVNLTINNSVLQYKYTKKRKTENQQSGHSAIVEILFAREIL